MPLLAAYRAAAERVDPDGARRAGGDETDPWCTRAGLSQLWQYAGLEEVKDGKALGERRISRGSTMPG
jgi:hypothetical protein